MPREATELALVAERVRTPSRDARAEARVSTALTKCSLLPSLITE
ncbi:hypothetical protein PC116_g22401 [Phytophthora cactorum]|uniref:Uncharacterized protein n=1 Tax=Phytophthora cactorum TaxID=29920 RepID=A0A8T1BTA1_9STRA|nr:hypothetical protein Pcac1_g9450 [Phytophthora cactorum]KAG2882994.1 hypothetical protein PC114_g20768 [Phytophthora cactorum]KAG2906164.1 hypothetical protein PC117_g20577 [Phytophthora cactorum]KAG3002329.1 hypothetical protein PC120_g19792 [Phytophthora cactorum]KAG3014519.1 hypothetical protein PC119_g12131 [Phytophthora cactorum]